ncbi:MAG: ribonuclease P protein subunit [bacterium]|nr:ribonuclease P protein subunit [bacterium]
MMLKDIIKGEFIGVNIEISDSKNKSDIGMKGQIVDETKNTLIIKTEEGKKTIFKDRCTIDVLLPEQRLRLEAGVLCGRPEERIRMKKK